jgi:hypothetical protein
MVMSLPDGCQKNIYTSTLKELGLSVIGTKPSVQPDLLPDKMRLHKFWDHKKVIKEIRA